MAENEGQTTNPFGKIVGSFLGPLEPLVTLGLSAIIKWVVVQGPLVLRLCAGISLIAFLATGAWFWYSFSGLQDLFLNGIAARLDDPNQNHPGIEALVLSGLQNLPDTLGSVHVTDNFLQVYIRIQDEIASPVDTPLPVISVYSTGSRKTLLEKYLMSADNDLTKKRGFLFIPAVLVPQQQLSGELTDESLKAALLKAPELLEDLKTSEAIAGDLCALTDVSMFDDARAVRSQPVQAYFISARGLIRICEGKTNLQKDYYSDQFEPTSFFPSRTYFKNAISALVPPLTASSSTQDRELHRSFTLTHPYIDLGGNGLVVTACRPMSTKGKSIRDAVLCVDLGLAGTEVSNLKTHIERIGGATTEITCSASPSVQCSGTGKWNKDVEQRVNELGSKSLLSDFYGKIQVVSQEGSALGFTIPIEQKLGQAGRTGTVIYCALDIGKVQWWNLVKGSLVAASFLSFVAFVILLIADYGARMHEQDRAFQTVASVMQDAPAPYIRLGINDEFIDLNDAFAKLLGYSSLLDARKHLTGQTFSSLLADEDSKTTYKTIDQCRLDRKPTSNYRINLLRLDGSLITVVIHGAAVPNPVSPRGTVPQTFGIVVASTAAGSPVTEIPKRTAM